MGFYDRHYLKEDSGGYRAGMGGGGGVGLAFPKPGPAVKLIMIACGVVWFVQLLTVSSGSPLSTHFGATARGWWQAWRYVTFQFLHSPVSLWHIGLNMLGLYFFGTPLERRWGTKGFLKFYLTCGCFSGLAYVTVQAILMPPAAWGTPLIGASGGVFAVLFACAVLYPGMRVLVMFIFPLPIRWLAGLIFAGMVVVIIQTLQTRSMMTNPTFWSHVAHLGGVIPALVWVLVLPRIRAAARDAGEAAGRGSWERKIKAQEQHEAEIDRILEKIKTAGIESLSGREKRILKRATERQKREDRQYNPRL